MTLKFYDKAGKPIRVDQWAELLDDDAYRQLAETKIGVLRVSTIWLGFDKLERVPPHMFETMVLAGTHELECRRYITVEAALEGHAEAVSRCPQPQKGHDE